MHGAERFRERYGPWAVVAGGPERERLEAQASELRLAARVRWLGALPADAVARLWPTLDVLVAPSRRTADWEEPGAPLRRLGRRLDRQHRARDQADLDWLGRGRARAGSSKRTGQQRPRTPRKTDRA